jgi:hypothetical protein
VNRVLDRVDSGRECGDGAVIARTCCCYPMPSSFSVSAPGSAGTT